jgi:hypothetical protein
MGVVLLQDRTEALCRHTGTRVNPATSLARE